MLVDLRAKKRAVQNRKSFLGLFFVLFLAASGVAGIMYWKGHKDAVLTEETPLVVSPLSPAPEGEPIEAVETWQFVPGPISMEDVKKKGCVADGFLSDYGDDRKEMVKLINRSECVYLHRALETWLHRPDFEKAQEVMQQVEKDKIIYGMFLAEAIRSNDEYRDPLGGKQYEFDKMCRKGTEGRWGEKTCVPSLSSLEYRLYLKALTRRAMDLGIQSFLFGQVLLQDEDPTYARTEIRKVIENMRAYAKEKKMEIIIGGQTDNITDEKYLRLFDYLDGGVGIGEDGKIESGPCWSRMSNCWALLWHERYSKKAKNVLLHLDWSGITWDDMSCFSRMEKKQRIETLRYLYEYFTSREIGFLMPYLAVVNRSDGGCHGPSKEFYSPSDKYECRDEDEIEKIMRGG